MSSEAIIRFLTIGSLGGLLLAVGLRLTYRQVAESVKGSRFALILVVNFVAVPLICVAGASLGRLGPEETAAIILLGAAPFAPVVPVFARMARADLPLAAGLTSIYPIVSAILTPWICGVLVKRAAHRQELSFSSGEVMLVLVATITLPLVVGIWLNHLSPSLSQRLLRPLEVMSEAAGALSLSFVILVNYRTIAAMGVGSLLVMAIVFEICFAAGYLLGHSRHSKRVIAIGTSNRNIALAILVALQGFAGTQVLSAVVGFGLLMILLGLAHVGFWRLRDLRLERAAAK